MAANRSASDRFSAPLYARKTLKDATTRAHDLAELTLHRLLEAHHRHVKRVVERGEPARPWTATTRTPPGGSSWGPGQIISISVVVPPASAALLADS